MLYIASREIGAADRPCRHRVSLGDPHGNRTSSRACRPSGAIAPRDRQWLRMHRLVRHPFGVGSVDRATLLVSAGRGRPRARTVAEMRIE
jgi:hypothetical protein